MSYAGTNRWYFEHFPFSFAVFSLFYSTNCNSKPLSWNTVLIREPLLETRLLNEEVGKKQKFPTHLAKFSFSNRPPACPPTTGLLVLMLLSKLPPYDLINHSSGQRPQQGGLTFKIREATNGNSSCLQCLGSLFGLPQPITRKGVSYA